MSELQTETASPEDKGIIIDGPSEVEETGEVAGSELAPDSEGQREDKDQGKADNDAVQKAINKQHAKYREEERKRIALEEEAKKLREKLEALEANNSEVVIPPIPDPYDDDYEEQIRRRDEALQRKAMLDAQKSVEQQRLNEQTEAEKRKEQERSRELANNFDSRIKAIGLNEEEIGRAADTVVYNGISREIGEFLLSDDDGPLITQYLAMNPVEQDELRYMSTAQAILKVNSDIREAASRLKPRASSTPEPVETLEGRGAIEKRSARLDGARFD